MIKFVKKINISLFVIILLLMGSVHAKNDNNDYYGTIEATKRYFDSKKVRSYEELSEKEKEELYNIIDSLKPVESLKRSGGTTIPSGKRNNKIPLGGNYYGEIFITMDNSTIGFRHGHAGIGSDGPGHVIEANPGDGVKLYKNRIKDYWIKCNTGGIMRVRGASAKKYRTAYNYAKSKIGFKYSIISKSDSFYCSELVYYAWKRAGYNIASGKWGYHYSPYDIMSDNDTYYLYKWRI